MAEDKGLWYATRIIFGLMLFFWFMASVILSVDKTDSIGMLCSLIADCLVIATFVLSILHLRKYEPKGLAVTSLVISSIGVLIILVVILNGAV